MRILFSVMLALFVLAGHPAWSDDTAETQARIRALREQVQELEVRDTVLRARIEEVGLAPTSEKGIENAEWRRDNNARQIDSLQHVIDSYSVSVEEMEELRRQADAMPREHQRSLAQHAGAKGMETAFEAMGVPAPAIILGKAAGKVISYGGRYVIKEMSETTIREMVQAERRHLIHVLDIKIALERERAAEINRIRQLRELQRESSEIMSELAPARQRLAALTGNAHDEAIQVRETDAADDAEQQRIHEAAGRHMIVRPCGPGDGRPRNFGVRQAQRDKDAPPAGKGGGEKTLAGKDASADQCVDLAGNWTFQTTSYLSAKPMPPVRVEIAAAASGKTEDAPQAYDIFMPDREHAQNGPHMRCTLAGLQLNCQVRALPATCPADQQVWDSLELTVAGDGSNISGDHAPGYSIDPHGSKGFCTAKPFKAPGKITYRFVPAGQGAK